MYFEWTFWCKNSNNFLNCLLYSTTYVAGGKSSVLQCATYIVSFLWCNKIVNQTFFVWKLFSRIFFFIAKKQTIWILSHNGPKSKLRSEYMWEFIESYWVLLNSCLTLTFVLSMFSNKIKDLRQFVGHHNYSDWHWYKPFNGGCFTLDFMDIRHCRDVLWVRSFRRCYIIHDKCVCEWLLLGWLGAHL